MQTDIAPPDSGRRSDELAGQSRPTADGAVMNCHRCGLPAHEGVSCDHAVSLWTRDNGLTPDQARVILLQQKKRAEQERAAKAAQNGSGSDFSSGTSPSGRGAPPPIPERRKPGEGESFGRLEGGGDGRSTGRVSPKTDKAVAFLRDRLRNGARVLSGEIRRKAADEGISEKALRLARQRLGIRPQAEGMWKDRRTYWSLPEGRYSMSDACPDCGYRHGPLEQHRLAIDFQPQRPRRRASATASVTKPTMAHEASLLPPCEHCAFPIRGRCTDVTPGEMIAAILGRGWRGKQALRQARWRKAHPDRHRQQQYYYRLRRRAKGDR
jgi:hypothetical protein